MKLNLKIAIEENIIESINKLKAINKEIKERIITKDAKGIDEQNMNFIELLIISKSYELGFEREYVKLKLKLFSGIKR